MGYSRAQFDLNQPSGRSTFHRDLGLQNIGISVHTLQRGEGFAYFHNHREQEEVYLCLSGSADLRILNDAGSESSETLELEAGDIVRVDAQTLRAIGNLRSDLAVILIAGGCPHPYPAGIGDHDVIADVLSIERTDTGFIPAEGSSNSDNAPPEDC